MQIQMPARRSRGGKKRGHDVLQPLCPRRFIALRKLRPAAAEHAVNVAHQIPFVLRQRRGIAEHHQHAALQGDLIAVQRTQQQINNLNGRGFIPVDTR